VDEPAVAPLVLVSVVEENLHATLQLDTRHAIVGRAKLAALFITLIRNP
jgi:hypothetical protein